MLSILIPTYNEKDNIEPLVRALSNIIKQKYEIIIVDDNSPDNTAAVVRKLSESHPNLRLLKRKQKQGLSKAIVAGVDVAKGEEILVMDGDLSHPPEAVPKLAASLQEYDLVIGSRLIKGGGVKNWPFHRKLISKGAETIARLLITTDCSDPLSGFFAIKKSVFKKTNIRTQGYKILLNILVDNPGIRIIEVPYTFKDRHKGKTKLGNKEIIEYILDIIRIKCK